MKTNTDKTGVITFTRTTNVVNYNYKLYDKCITRTDPIKDLAALLDSKLVFHHHVDCIFSQSLKILGLTRALTCSFPTVERLVLLSFTLVTSK